MSINKRMRDAKALAEAELARRALDLKVIPQRGAHSRLVLCSRDGQRIMPVIFSSTPSCHRWLEHLRKDLRRALLVYERTVASSGVRGV